MKKITAVIRPFKLDDVRNGLGKVGVGGMTIAEVQGNGRGTGHTEIYRGATTQVELEPRIRLDVIVPDDTVEKVLLELADSARTGRAGDGKIYVVAVDRVVRVRTGEEGAAALN